MLIGQSASHGGPLFAIVHHRVHRGTVTQKQLFVFDLVCGIVETKYRANVD